MEKFVPKTANNAPVKFMAIGAHQDDIEIMALDGIFKGQSKDASFTAVVLADGAGCPKNQKYANLSPIEIMELRIGEQKKASEIGRYNALYLLKKSSKEIKEQGLALSFTDSGKTWLTKAESQNAEDKKPVTENQSGVAENEIVQQIRQILLKNPKLDTLYIHNLCDKHPTHVSAAKLALFAVLSLPFECRPQRVVGCEVWRSLDWLNDEDKVVFNLDNPKLAQQLLAVYESQNSAKSYDLGAKGRRLANATFGESHSQNDASEIWLGMDLTALILPNAPSVSDFLKDKIRNFEISVLANYKN